MQNEDIQLIREKRDKFRVEIRRKENEKLFKTNRMTNLVVGLPIKQRAQIFLENIKNQSQNDDQSLTLLAKKLNPQTQEECIELLQNEQFKESIVHILTENKTNHNLNSSIINCLIDMTYYELDSIEQFIQDFKLLDLEITLMDNQIAEENKIELLYLIFNTVMHIKNSHSTFEFSKVELCLFKFLQQKENTDKLLKMVLMIILLIVDQLQEIEKIFDLVSKQICTDCSENNKILAIRIIVKLISSSKLDPENKIILKYYDQFQEIFLGLNNDSKLIVSLIRYFTEVSSLPIQQDANISNNIFIRFADILIMNDNVETICDLLVFFANMILVNEKFHQIIFQNSFILQKIKNLLIYQEKCFFELWNLSCLLIWAYGSVLFDFFEKNGVLEVLIDKFIQMTETKLINQFLEALLSIKDSTIISKYPSLVNRLSFHSINSKDDTAEMSALLLNQLSL